MKHSARPPTLPGQLHHALAALTLYLQDRQVDSPRLSAEVLLAKAMGLKREGLLKGLLMNPEEEIGEERLCLAQDYAVRRAKGEPVAYILGTKEFYGRDFKVTPSTLIPRPETELLVDLALNYARRPQSAACGLFADFGTGSGCIAVTLALELPAWRGIALEIEDDALAVARHNAKRYETANLACVHGDFTRPPLADQSLDLLVSNPPYVSEAEYEGLDREVRSFEPKSALVPGASGAKRPKGAARPDSSPAPGTGLEDALAIIALAEPLLKPGGRFFMEIGYTQGGPLLAALAKGNWTKASVRKDHAGLN
ncbi:peptide chain release factor N(5)-glutamine methyltransferase, partial [Desulfovibrio sp. OttesenSCG-928-A18]|nr:peptide chain release factor N(5)-glutamine methyltransferase [Desulfovibrio sp. OttesenSCG-928-A18]